MATPETEQDFIDFAMTSAAASAQAPARDEREPEQRHADALADIEGWLDTLFDGEGSELGRGTSTSPQGT